MELGTGVVGPANCLTREVALWCRGRLNICRTGTNISVNVGPMAVCPVLNQAANSAAAFALRRLLSFGLCGIARTRYYDICVVPWTMLKCFTKC
jgi:hypothetical protein